MEEGKKTADAHRIMSNEDVCACLLMLMWQQTKGGVEGKESANWKGAFSPCHVMSLQSIQVPTKYMVYNVRSWNENPIEDAGRCYQGS